MFVMGLKIWEMVTHQAVSAEHPTQVTGDRVKGSAPDVWVKKLSHIAPLGFIVSNG